MVTVSTVESDKVFLDNVYDMYADTIEQCTVDSVWKGASRDHAREMCTETLDSNRKIVMAQMVIFKEAMELYDNYKVLKSENESLHNLYNSMDDTSGKEEEALRSKILSKTTEMGELRTRINSLLNAIKEMSVMDTEGVDVGAYSVKFDNGEKIDLGYKGSREFVNYYQEDYNDPYGSGRTISSSGCGPTSMAMIVTYLTEYDLDPREAARWSLDHGYRYPQGTAFAYFGEYGKEFGIKFDEIYKDKNRMQEELEEGNMILLSVGPGIFTSGNHFIVLTDYDPETGTVGVADPGSEERSHTRYSIDQFYGQINKTYIVRDSEEVILEEEEGQSVVYG